MPFIPTVTPSQNPRTGIPSSRANPDAFGANIAQAQSELGGAVIQAGAAVAGAAELQQTRGDMERKLNVATAYANADYTKQNLDLSVSAPPGGDGYFDTVKNDYSAWVETKVSDYGAQFPDDSKGADELRLKLLGRQPGIVSDAAVDQLHMKEAYSQNETQKGLSTQLNAIRANPTLDNYVHSTEAGLELINAQIGYDANAKAAGATAFKSQSASAYFEAKLMAADTPEEIAAIQKELGQERWRTEFAADNYESIVKAAESERVSKGAGLSALVTSEVSELVSRNSASHGEPDTLIPVDQINATLERACGLYGSASQCTNMRQVATYQQAFREQGGRKAGVGQPISASMAAASNAIASIESRGSGDYKAVGPLTEKGNRAYGLHQVMDFNVGPWTKKYYGTELTPQQFLDNKEAQDMVFAGEFGRLTAKYGNMAMAAAAWFAGEKGMNNALASDVVGTTVAGYMSKFSAAINGKPGIVPTADGSPGMTNEEFWRQDALRKYKENQDAAIHTNFADFLVNTPSVMQDGSDMPTLDMNDPSSFEDYGAAVAYNAQKYGVTPDDIKPFTTENLALAETLLAGNDVEGKMRLFANIGRWSPQMQDYAYKQLGEKDPTVGVIGNHFSAGNGGVARSIINGQTLLTGNPNIEKGWNTTGGADAALVAYNGVVGDAIAGFNPETQAVMLSVSNAIYADMTKRNPTGAFDPTTYEQAVAQAFGMVVEDVNGVNTFLPPDIDPGKAEDWVQSMTVTQWGANSLDRTLPVDGTGNVVSQEEMSGAQLYAADNEGHYMVAISDGFVMSGVSDANGNPKPFILTMTKDAIETDTAEPVEPTAPAVTTPPAPLAVPSDPMRSRAPPSEARTKDNTIAPVDKTPTGRPLQQTLNDRLVVLSNSFKKSLLGQGISEAEATRMTKDYLDELKRQ